jgi:hypothetical protein
MCDEVSIMVCNSCGRDIKNEAANFCEYCGVSFREGDSYEVKPSFNKSKLPPPMPIAVEANQNEKPVSFLNWLGTLLIPLIPLVGLLVYLVMLIIWSVGGNDVQESKKNWARAQLVFSLIVLIITIVFIVYLVFTPEFQEAYKEMLDNINNYQ